MKNSKYSTIFLVVFAVFILFSLFYTLFVYKTDYLKIFVVYYKPAPLIKSEIFDLILNAANSGEYKVEIEPAGNTSELFKLINQSNIEDELHKLGYATSYEHKSSYGDSMFIIRWDNDIECDDV